MKKLKQLNIAMILLLLVFQTVLSPISVFASEVVPNTGVTETPETTGTTSPEEPATDTGTPEPPVKTEEVKDTVTPPTETDNSGGTVEETPKDEQTPVQPDDSTSTEKNENGDGATEGEKSSTEGDKAATDDTDKDKVLPPNTEDPKTLVRDPKEIPLSAVDFEMLINGEKVTSSYNKELQPNQKSNITFTFTVNLEEAHNAGDFFTFDLPASIIDFENNFNGSKKAGLNNPAYSYSTSGQTVTVKLDETVTDPNLLGSEAKLIASFESGFNLQGDSLEQDLVIPQGLAGQETITLNFLPSTSNAKISKENKGATSKNGERIIDWEVWVNKAGKNLKDATLTDVTTVNNSASHEVVPGSVQVTKYEMGLHGYKDETADPDYLIDGNFSDISFNGRYAYKVNYQTKVTEANPEGLKNFNNTVTLTNGSDTETSDVATQPIKYGDALAKKFTSGDNYKSSWEIKYNYNEVKVDNPVITDTLPGAHKIDTNSIQVFEVTVDENGNEISSNKITSGFHSEAITDGFKLTFDKPVTKAYKITYDANYDQDFYTGSTTTLTNIVEAGTYKRPASHTISENILTKSRSVNFDTKEITWTITVSADNNTTNGKDITGLEIVDNFETSSKNGKHTLVGGKDGITVDKMTGHSISLIDENDLSKGFKITGGTVKKGETATITYKTSYEIADDGSVIHNGYGNTATANWMSSGKTYTVTKTADYTPATTTVNNGSKSGGFNHLTQEFTWNVKVNINKKDINGALLTDNLGDGHKIVEDSFTVYQYTLTTDDDNKGIKGNPLDSSKYDLTIAPDNKSYTLKFKDLDNKTNNQVYLVEYKSKDSNHVLGIESDKASDKGDTYTNTATFKTLNDTKTYTLEAKVTVDEANNLLSKSVQQNSGKQTIIWTLDVNKSHSTLKNVKVSDFPSGYLMLIPDSIQIRPYVVNETGISAEGSWESPAKFGVTVEYDKASGGFTLNFGDLTKKGYQVRYETLGLGKQNTGSGNPEEEFSNKATMTFDDSSAANQGTGSQVDRKFNFSSSDTDFQLTKGNLKLKKIGVNPATGDKQALAGVEFELIKKIGSNVYVIAKATSSDKGYFEFNAINYGTYYVREVKAPDDYAKMDDQLLKLDATTDSNVVPEKVTEVENVKKITSGAMCPNFTLTIKDIDGELVVNKKITLQDDKGNIKFTGTTNNEGKVIIPREGSEAVKAGSYKVFEGAEELGTVTVKYSKGECHAELQPPIACKQFTITLKDKDNNPRPHVAVTLKDKDGKVIISSKTDENGKLIVPSNPPAGKYDLYEGKQFLSEVNISYKKGCEIEVQQAPSCPSFTLTVKDVDGKPREGVTVTIKNEDTNEIIKQTIAPTDSEGKVKIKNLEPGKYVVYDGANEIGKFTVNTDCEATVQPIPACPQFTLTVKDENGKVRPNVDNITIKDKTGAIIATNKTTNELGQITIPSENIPSGVYDVYQGDLYIGQITVQYSVKCEAEISVAPACPAFTLTVQTEFGTPLANAKITVKDAKGNVIKGADGNEILTTSVMGTIVLPDKAIKQGTYYVYEGSRLIGSFTVKDTCSAIVKPSSTGGGGGGWTPDPEKPVDPNKPNPDPGKPVDPNKPNPDPGKPVDPNKPNPDPGKPVDPNKPNPDPEKPVDPNKPNPDPEKPVDPEKPTTESEKPVDPEKPTTESEKPVDPKNPGNSATDTKNPSNPGKPSVTDVIDQGKNLPPYNPSTANKDTLDSYKDFLNKYDNLSKKEQAEVARSLDIDKIKADAEKMEAQLKAEGKLPQTNGANQTALTLVGVALVLGALFLLRRRKTEVK
ncbi:collagen binding domain-containing protein [Lysinibacillus sp. fls2-241-R2A-57]|uniref:collagen binding domain-containing protein n=1 Tax=Lysinibacillus sp. fls2-241-R2A-57 TaxID=3040292 RepID=UPI002553C2EE|nr:collagen binding domain-containing protein [Lysinibacillus sp. fls2-241-R2A-57]